MLPMMRNQTMKPWRSVEQWLLGSMLLALVTLACIWFVRSPAPMVPAYLIAMVLLVALLLASWIVTRLVGSIRRQTEAALQGRARAEQAQRELRLVVDAIPAPVWSARPDGSRDFHSQRWLEFTGLSAEAASGEGWLAAVHPKDRAAIRDQWRSATAAGEPFEVESRGRSASGEYRWFLVRAEPFRDEKGTIVKWYGSNTDIEDRKRAIEALRESEKQWREVFEHNPVMYFMVDATGTVLSVNTFGAAQLGYSVSELLGQSVLNVFFEEDQDRVRKNVAVCLEHIGRTHSWEIRKVRRDGSVLWVRENAKAVRRSDSRLIVLIACEDITERKQAENALRQSETYLAEAQRLSHTGSFGWCTGTGEIDWSEETFRIFGYDRAPSVNINMVVDRIHPDDRPIAQQVIDRAVSDGKDFDHEYRLLMPDGSVKYVHAVARAANDASGSFAFVGAVTDVTARKQAEQELRESEQRFRDYAETASDWLWETGPDHRLSSVTQKGGPVTTQIGRAPWAFATDFEEEPEKWQVHFANLDEHMSFRDFKYRTVRSDGSVRHVSSSGKPVFDREGRFLGYRGVASDVTNAVRTEQTEEALREAQAELAHVTRVTALGELTASIAHEVNQPLAAVVTNAAACLRWLDRETPNLDEARRAVESIVNDCNRAGEVIQRVRALVNKTAPQKVLLNINDVVNEVITLVQHELFSHRVSLRMELTPGLPMVLADRVQLQQVILNLVINGIEAMQPLTDQPRELVILTHQDEAHQVVVAVKDCGTGISTESADRLFNAFFTTKSSGMGMGLSICRSIVDAHGGRLSASGNIGPGATFQFTLPVHPEDDPP
jgi:PAS domain S-box-containing protein